MKKLLIMGIALCAQILLAAYDTWTDPDTGIAWNYVVSDEAAKEAKLGGSYYLEGPCIPSTMSGHLVIPNSINGYTVVGMYANAFKGCSEITGITFPSGLRSMEGTPLYSMTSLHTLKIPEGIDVDLSAWTNTSASSTLSRIKTIYAYGDVFSLEGTSLEYFYYTPKYAEQWKVQIAKDHPIGLQICTGNTVKVVPALFNGGATSIRKSALFDWDASVSLTATPKDGYEFLGWSSDVEGISGTETTLTFIMPKQDVTVVPNFFPQALVEGWIQAEIARQLEAGTLVKPDDIEAKVKAEVQKQATPIKEAGVQEALDADEVYTADEMQVMAYGDPMIEVVDGKATVGIALKKATSLDGEWVAVNVTDPGAQDGKVIVEVEPEEGETTAFYRFVVGDEDEKESEASAGQ